jgi:SsrA-binding protein
MAKKKKDDSGIKVIADNRKARHNYAIEDSLEAGIELQGTEVKALRTGKATLGESYAQAKGGEITLVNLHIPEYEAGNRFNHEPTRPRKLLLHKREIAKLSMAVQREGMTLIPLKLYFNEKGRAKLQLGVARGKKLHDKRATEKARDWARDKGRLLRAKG